MYRQFLQEIIRAHHLIGVESAESPPDDSGCLPAPDWVTEGPVYEIFIRNFSGQGTIPQIEKRLDDLKDLGIKTLWLMPFYPIGEKNRKGSVGSPYAIRDYQAIDPQLGTEKDLQQLVRLVHHYDMRLIIDMVANHAAPDHVWFDKHPDFFLPAENVSLRRKMSDWTDVLDLNYKQPDLRQQMGKVCRYWIEKFDIDGYRCDVAGLVPLDFWQDVVAELVKIKSDIFMLAEWESPRLHQRAFHATYDWTTLAILEDIYQGRRAAGDSLQWVQQKENAYPTNSLFLRFTENHDLTRTTQVFGRQSFYPYVVFQYTLAGIPLLYNGQETGLRKMPDPFNPDPIKWELGNEAVRSFYRRLIAIRNKYPALNSSRISVLKNNRQNKVISFVKHGADNDILVIINFSSETIAVDVDLSGIDSGTGIYTDLFRDLERKQDDLETLSAEPYGFYLLRIN